MRMSRVAAGGTRARLMRWRWALRADFACDARLGVARHNSLRDLRSLRSDRCRESVHEARAWRHAPTPRLRFSPPLNRPSRVPPAARAAEVAFAARATAVSARHVKSHLSERGERSER